MAHYQHVDLDGRHRVFVAGDLHGCLDLLNAKLEVARYNPARDVLILVGDIANRGSRSAECIELLDRDDVYAVRGNHEQLLIDCYLEPDDSNKLTMLDRAGGRWFNDLDRFAQRPIYDRLIKLPIALEVITPKDRSVGFTHASVPGNDWRKLKSRSPKREDLDFAIRDRTQVREAQNWLDFHERGEYFPGIRGVDHVFHGHTILPKPLHLANRSWIDTGGYKTDQITVLEIDTFLSRQSALAA